jgi:hypothetical protein
MLLDEIVFEDQSFFFRLGQDGSDGIHPSKQVGDARTFVASPDEIALDTVFEI